MSRFVKPILAASLIINLSLGVFICLRHVYEQRWTRSLAGNARAISAVADAYFLAHPEAQFVRYPDLKAWDKTEWLEKNEQPERLYQPVFQRGESEVMILFMGRYGTLGLKH